MNRDLQNGFLESSTEDINPHHPAMFSIDARATHISWLSLYHWKRNNGCSDCSRVSWCLLSPHLCGCQRPVGDRGRRIAYGNHRIRVCRWNHKNTVQSAHGHSVCQCLSRDSLREPAEAILTSTETVCVDHSAGSAESEAGLHTALYRLV